MVTGILLQPDDQRLLPEPVRSIERRELPGAAVMVRKTVQHGKELEKREVSCV